MADLRPYLFPEWYPRDEPFDYDRLAHEVHDLVIELKALRPRCVDDDEELEFVDDAIASCATALAVWEEWKHFDPDHAFPALDNAKHDARIILGASPYRNTQHPTTEQENTTP